MSPEEQLYHCIDRRQTCRLRLLLRRRPELAGASWRDQSMLDHAVCRMARSLRRGRYREARQALAVFLILCRRLSDFDPVNESDGQTPLFATAAMPGICGTLLEKGARADRRDAGGRSILHVFLTDSDVEPESVESVIAAGAEINAADADGQTPLDRFDDYRASFMCFNRGLAAIRKTLLAAGARRSRPVAAIEPIPFELVILGKEAFEAMNSSFPGPEAAEGMDAGALEAEYDEFYRLSLETLSHVNGNYAVHLEFQETFFNCGGVYSNSAVCRDYVEAILSAMARLPHREQWSYHTVCELNEDEPLIDFNGQFLIRHGKVYAPDDGNDYSRLLIPARD